MTCPVRYASSESGDETLTSTELDEPLADPLQPRARNSAAVGTSQLPEWSQRTSDDNIGVVDDTGSSTGGYNDNGFKLIPFKYSLEIKKPSCSPTSVLITTGCRDCALNTNTDKFNSAFQKYCDRYLYHSTKVPVYYAAFLEGISTR